MRDNHKCGSRTLPPKGSLSLHLSPCQHRSPDRYAPANPNNPKPTRQTPNNPPLPKNNAQTPDRALAPITHPHAGQDTCNPRPAKRTQSHFRTPHNNQRPQCVRVSMSINPFRANPPSPPCRTTLVPFPDTSLHRPAVRTRTAAPPTSPPTPQSTHGNQLAPGRVTLS
jgi:hypothetical protein